MGNSQPKTMAVMRTLTRGALGCCIASAALACASNDEAEADPTPSARDDDDDSSDEHGDGGSSDAPRLYAIATAVSDDSPSNTYVEVFGEFERELDLSTAREFPGWSDMGVIGRYLFVSSGEGPTVWRFRWENDGTLVDDGEINFGRYVDDANFYSQTLISDTKAYLLGNGEYIVWNPSTLRIVGTFPFPDLADREGIPPYYALDRGAVLRGDRLYHAVTWSDAQELHMLPDSRIVSIDTEADQVLEVLTVDCPDLAVADRDEAGNLYFSNWVYSPGYTLLRDGVEACAARIPAGAEQPDDWRLAHAEFRLPLSSSARAFEGTRVRGRSCFTAPRPHTPGSPRCPG